MKSCLVVGLPKRFFCLLNKANVLYKQKMKEKKRKKKGRASWKRNGKTRMLGKPSFPRLSNLKSGFCDTCNTHQAGDVKLNTLQISNQSLTALPLYLLYESYLPYKEIPRQRVLLVMFSPTIPHILPVSTLFQGKVITEKPWLF